MNWLTGSLGLITRMRVLAAIGHPNADVLEAAAFELEKAIARREGNVLSPACATSHELWYSECCRLNVEVHNQWFSAVSLWRMEFLIKGFVP